MSAGAAAWLMPAGLGIVGAAVRLFASELAARRWPRLHGWLIGYRGVTLRWAALAVVMVGTAIFVLVLASGTSELGNRNFLWVFAGLIAACALFFLEQARRTLPQATFETSPSILPVTTSDN